jgi:hypothetical protein
MNAFIRTLIVPLIAGAVFASAHAAPYTNSSADYGTIVSASVADREVAISASTRYVNVVDGQTIRFDVDGQVFTFAFHTWPGDQSVDLALIAPKDMAVPHVRVYIASNRTYLG